MTTLRIYGDSFASMQPSNRITSWPTLLAAQLDLPMSNKAVSGSGTEYSIKQLCFDFWDGIICNGDIVIIVLSSLGRLNFQYQEERPETASIYLRDPGGNRHEHLWYWKNKKYIEWYIVNQDCNMHSINHTAYVSLIKDIAITLPDCKFIILENMNSQIHLELNTYPKNLLHPHISLNKISNDEFDMNNDLKYPYSYWTEFTVYDARQNHLSIPNLKILSELLFESIQTMDITNITADKFMKHHLPRITTKDEYMNYVNCGYIDYNEWMFLQIKNKI
jgi:hypothetical protein